MTHDPNERGLKLTGRLAMQSCLSRVYWEYKGACLELDFVINYKGVRYRVPVYGGEGLSHVLLKLVVVVHLVVWGYPWEKVHLEKVERIGSKAFRADIFVEGTDGLPSFWFECGDTDKEKLSLIAGHLHGVRVVHVIHYQWFERLWNCNEVILNDEFVPIESIEDRSVMRDLVKRTRESMIPPNTEVWAVNAVGGNPRIFYAVKRKPDGTIVYMDTGEGRSLSSFKFIPKAKEYYEPLIPGIVGSPDWRGQNSMKWD